MYRWIDIEFHNLSQNKAFLKSQVRLRKQPCLLREPAPLPLPLIATHAFPWISLVIAPNYEHKYQNQVTINEQLSKSKKSDTPTKKDNGFYKNRELVHHLIYYRYIISITTSKAEDNFLDQHNLSVHSNEAAKKTTKTHPLTPRTKSHIVDSNQTHQYPEQSHQRFKLKPIYQKPKKVRSFGCIFTKRERKPEPRSCSRKSS